MKVNLMSDTTILNRDSVSSAPSGIPVSLPPERLVDIRRRLVEILSKGAFIGFESHAIDRILEDSLRAKDDPEKRGWESQDEVTNCVLHVNRVSGFRLNVNYRDTRNTERVKHLHPHAALIIQGNRGGKEDGRLVLVIISEKQVSVITVL